MRFAHKELEKILDLLQYSVSIIYPENQIFLGLQGPITKETFTFSFILDPNYKFSSTIIGLEGQINKFKINAKNIKKMHEIGVFKISTILEKFEDSLTPFEQTLITGIHWFANSQNQTKLENQFLSLMICLEVFLTPDDDRDPISTSIAEAASILLNPEHKRSKFVSKIKKFYTKRSAIVHGRKRLHKNENLSREDVNKLREIVGNLIQWMANHKDSFESKKELLQHISDYKISGDVFMI